MYPLRLSQTIFITLIVSTFFFSSNSFSEEKKDPVDLQKTFEQIKADYERNIDNTDEFVQSLDLIDAKQKEFSALNIKLEECISKNSTKLAALKENLKLLGDEVPNEEDRDIKNKRKELNDQLQIIDNELKRCNLSKIQLKKYADEITKRRLDFLKQQLLSKETSVYSAATSLIGIKGKNEISKENVDTGSKHLKSLQDVLIAPLSWKELLFAFLGILIGWLWKRKESNQEIEPMERVVVCLSRYSDRLAVEAQRIKPRN